MIKKKSHTSAFTLIELLVVITIIGILAGIALPVFNSVQIKGQQTKCLAQAKQIGLALKLFATDNDGVFPRKGAPSVMTTAPSDANTALSALFPAYTRSEKIFDNKLSYFHGKGTNPAGADDVIDSTFSGTLGANTLQKGENVYGYMMGLSDTTPPSSPLLFDGAATNKGVYAAVTTAQGGVWSGVKAIVIRQDSSGAVETLDSAYTVKGQDPAATTTSSVNILDPAVNTSLTGCTHLLPL